MADPNKKAYRKKYAAEFAMAKRHLAPHGGTLEWVTHDYQCFQYREDGVCLVFYPHKTSAGNRHIRVRDQSSKDTKRASELIRSLDMESDAKYSCTFSAKNRHYQHFRKMMKGGGNG